MQMIVLLSLTTAGDCRVVVYKNWVLIKQEGGTDRPLASRMRTRTLHTVCYLFVCFSFSSYYDMYKQLFIGHIHLLVEPYYIIAAHHI